MNTTFIVARKEILDNSRDRRTLFSTLVFGPLFAPALFAVIINIAISRNIASVEEQLSIPIIGIEQAQNLAAFLAARGVDADENHTLTNIDDAATAVRTGRQDLVIVIDEDFAAEFSTEVGARVTLIFDQSNARAGSRVQRARRAVGAYSEQLGALRLLARGVNPSLLRPITIDEYDVSTPAGRSALILGMLTYFLLLSTLMGGLYLAIDTTAGERERKSLEPLLATPVPRANLLLGKMTATIFYMLISLALTLTGFTISLHYLPLEQLGMSSSFDTITALRAFAVIAPFAPLGAALMTLVASFTKSYKEAQTYLTFVLLIPTLPLVFAGLLNVRASLNLMWIPSLSQHLLVTNLIRDEPVGTAMFALSALSALAVAILLALAAIKLYKREALLG